MKPAGENFVSLREASVTDCRGMAKVSVDTWRSATKGLVPQGLLEKMSYEKRAEGFRKAFQQTSFYAPFVAVYRGVEVVGYAHAGAVRDRKWGNQAELYALHVLPAFQRRALGVRLFELAVKACIRHRQRGLVACVLEDNPYRGFYEKLGGKVLGHTDLDLGRTVARELVYGWDNLGRALKQAEQARQLQLPFFMGGVR
jgi:hypothetical protein